ncbi:calreticulin-like [Babylonia areolata]|uniref:calreticulin-like n=1 Tax=Babylonia areolata TaxID=304850 RepID=UPI003FD66FAC
MGMEETVKVFVFLLVFLRFSVAAEDKGTKGTKPKIHPTKDVRFRRDMKVYFQEEFDDGWEKRWVLSKHYGKKQGKFKLSAGTFYGDALKDRGLQTSTNNRYFGISAKFDKFTNENKTLVIQFSVKKEHKIECGGMYIKLFSSQLNQTDLNSETPYLIMFGPDICDVKRKLHIIFKYKGMNLECKKDILCRNDNFTHLYTLIVRPERTYEVLIDNKLQEVGDLENDWDFLLPRKIPQKKPADWDDRPKIDDPHHKKPLDWDQPKEIPDPYATIPPDWDFETQGKWKPPMIPNPDYLGEWKQKKIDNPNFKGLWLPKEADNPDYKPDKNLYAFPDIGAIGIDVWQVKAGTIFDNILITDDESYAKVHAVENFEQTRELEKIMKKALEDEEAWKKYRADRKKARKAEAIRRGIREEDLPQDDEDDEFPAKKAEREKKAKEKKKILHDEL